MDLSKNGQRIVMGSDNRFVVYRVGINNVYGYVQSINCYFGITGLSISADKV